MGKQKIEVEWIEILNCNTRHACFIFKDLFSHCKTKIVRVNNRHRLYVSDNRIPKSIPPNPLKPQRNAPGVEDTVKCVKSSEYNNNPLVSYEKLKIKHYFRKFGKSKICIEKPATHSA